MTMIDPASRQKQIARSVRSTALTCAALVLGMVAAAYASVPLYNLFCRATGYDGTPLVGTEAPDEVIARKVWVRLDTNVASDLPWSFTPETPEVEMRLGETQTVFFKVKNESSKPSTGIAAYNVQPGQVGAFFVKLKCFCFDEQTLRPGEEAEFPVVFYVDPSLVKDRSLDTLTSVTLSYTYFASRNGRPIASADNDAKSPRL